MSIRNIFQKHVFQNFDGTLSVHFSTPNDINHYFQTPFHLTRLSTGLKLCAIRNTVRNASVAFQQSKEEDATAAEEDQDRHTESEGG